MKSGQKSLKMQIKESVPAYLLILPTIVVFVIFLYMPFVNAVRISLYKYKGIGELKDFVGIENYIKVLHDRKFYMAFLNTFKLIGADLIFSLTIGFLLAYVLYKGIRFKKVLFPCLFIPYLISMVVIGSIWRILYDPNIGPINQILDVIGLGNLAQAWLSQKETALGAITVTWIWRTIPFNMLILYANIMTMSKDYLEAADIDGATSTQKLRYVVLPYLKPTFVTLIMLTVTNDLRAFDMVWIMTQGGPGGASEVMTSYVYRTAFQTQKFGTATAASIVMMVVMIAATVLLQVLKNRNGEEG